MFAGAGPSRRPLKRQRTEMFPKGSILRVGMHNFMIYKHAVVEPGPKLNLVLGPNGTGKSSLVCAISIGLGGRTNLLGRAEDLKDYVRKGEQRGWVEITLSSGDPARPHTVRREMNSHDNSSEWRLDGREARLKDVEELVREKLKVQLDNLCQFLPQDKVVEFARMKPVDLLEATENAIGNGELGEQHETLKEQRKNLADADVHKAALVTELGRLREENERAGRDVQNIQRQQEMLEQVRLAEKKLPWQKYEDKRQEFEMDKTRRDQAKEQLRQLQQTAQEDEGPLAERQASLDRLKAAKRKVEAELKELDARIVGGAAPAGRGRAGGSQQAQQAGLDDQMNDALDTVREKVAELEGLETAARQREADIAALQGEVAELERQAAALPPMGDTGQLGLDRQRLLQELQDVRTQESALDMQLDELRGGIEDLGRQRSQAADRLRRIDDAKMRRLRALDQRSPGIFQLWQWLQDNRARFRGPVFGPIAVEVECPDAFHVQCLENQVGAATWAFFVTQHQEDQDLLRAEAERLGRQPGRRPFIPAISNYAGDPSAPIQHPRGEAAEYARYGITQTLDRCFTAPNVVKRVLCDESRIHEVYIGGRDARVDDLLRDQQRVETIFAAGTAYRRVRSRYNAAANSMKVDDLRPARLLAGGASADDGRERDELAVQMRQCEQEIAMLQGQQRELEAAKADKTAQVRAIQERQQAVDGQIWAQANRHNQVRVALRTKRETLERRQRAPDPRKRRPKLERELAAAKKLGMEKALELARAVEGQGARLAHCAEVDLGVRELSMQCDRIKEASQHRRQRLEQLQGVAAQLAELCNRTRNECKRLKDEAEKVAELTEELTAAFAPLPDSVDGLHMFMAEKQAEADGVAIANPAALRQYNDRLARIAELQRQLEEVEEQRQLARDTIDDVKGRWLPELKRIVAQVNETFQDNFQWVGCAGEVTLLEAPGEDFERYAIEIRVKFRDSEALHTLDASHQSGGERSVSTIIYLIALQGVTVTPFRVVDEINQGMDPINERKVFRQLVEAACRPGTPQCFLLTPKLLPDLPFTRDVTVLQIMNGNHIKDVAVGFTMDKLLGSTRAAALAAA